MTSHFLKSLELQDEFGIGRNELMKKLEEKGIETRTFFIPMHKQPVFNRMGLFLGESYTIAEELSQRGLYLPSGSGLTAEHIQFICEAIKLAGK